MKNHIGYLESTALKQALSGCTGEKKRFPTKNTRTHTLFVDVNSGLQTLRVNAIGIRAANLPDFVGLAVCL